ncbi:DUF2442 domain-containing protein [Rhizobium tumorigenes]|uniref:DUF2442 domain-containing protein n=1 Tax=Rhizobium tumorigenes TaxID=2041385 RepID=UPI00241F11AD|nr:DUF2442 domain-containing protein [Rhizobium tumorigenes]WFS02131.1 DUF2442 domain-containing protein [Rhizobium tumorigenes]
MADVSDAELSAAKLRWEAERAQRPVPSSVRYDRQSGRIMVEFTNGAAFMVPARQIEGLVDATDAQLSEVELLGETGLHWESLDIDYTISGLMSGVFGSRSFMESQHKRSQPRTPTKISDDGANGANPRKQAE